MPKRHGRHSTAMKREIVEAYFQGASMRSLGQKYDVCRILIPIWIDKYERGEFDDDAVEEERIPEYETRIAALERLVGRQALEIEFLKGALQRRPTPKSEPGSVITGPQASPSKRGCELMGLHRSTFYAEPEIAPMDPVIAEIKAICESCRNYGYRRVTAKLRNRDFIVNSKKSVGLCANIA